MSPVPYTWGPFLAKIFLKIDEIKIRHDGLVMTMTGDFTSKMTGENF